MHGMSGDGRQTGSDPDAPEDGPVVELLHNAGLTAGHTLELRPGTFRLGPRRSDEGGLVAGTPEAVSFDLTVADDGGVTLTPGSEPVAVEGVAVERSARLDDGDMIQLTTDHFVLRSPAGPHQSRPPANITPRTVPAPHLPSMAFWLWLFGLIALFGIVVGFIRTGFFGLVLIGVGGIIATIAIRTRRRERAREEQSVQLANAKSLFFNEIVDSRKAAAEVLRTGASSPAAIARFAATSPPPPGSRLHVTVASGDRAWSPPVVCFRDPGWDYQGIVDDLSFLPAIPYTVDLDSSALALVGPRSATLAVARHLVTSALLNSASDAGVSVTTVVPADWRWIAPASVSELRILDGVAGEIGPRTVVIASSLDELRANANVEDPALVFPHIMQIDDHGRASIIDETGIGAGFVPHGITDRHARRLSAMMRDDGPIIDLRQPTVDALVDADHHLLDADRVLVAGRDRDRNKHVLATTALRQAVRHPDRSIFILDRGDRALIRLKQLDACRRYVTIDQIADVESVLDELDLIAARADDERVLLLAPDLWDTTAFYRNIGRSDLAGRIDALISQMELLPVAASTLDREQAPPGTFLVWVNTKDDDVADVEHTLDGQPDGSTQLDLRDLPGADLTGSVARLAMPTSEELSP